MLIERALSEAARKPMEMEPQVEKLFSEAHRRSYDRGKAEGKAEALLMVLRRRGVAVTNDQEQHITACTDMVALDRWMDRAFSVTSVDELFA